MRTPRPPRVLFIGNTTYDLPLSVGLARKWDSLAERLELRVIGQAGRVEQPDPRFRLIRLPRAVAGVFHLALPWVAGREMRRFRPDVIVTQSPYEAVPILAALAASRSKPKLIVEIHGDWQSASRGYGSRFRRVLAPAADYAALLALRRADGLRAISPFTAKLAASVAPRTPLRAFPAYTHLESFLSRGPEPLPDVPTVAWIGSLQRTKDPETFADAWRLVAARLPDARAIVVGDGPLRPVIDELCTEFPDRVRAVQGLSPPAVAQVLDESRLLVLPSRSEGLGRVVIEAFARARPVVGSAVGGIPDIVRDGHSGLLVQPGDARGLADALIRVLGDRDMNEQLAAGALSDGKAFQWLPERYADAVRELVDRVVG